MDILVQRMYKENEKKNEEERLEKTFGKKFDIHVLLPLFEPHTACTSGIVRKETNHLTKA